MITVGTCLGRAAKRGRWQARHLSQGYLPIRFVDLWVDFGAWPSKFAAEALATVPMRALTELSAAASGLLGDHGY